MADSVQFIVSIDWDGDGFGAGDVLTDVRSITELTRGLGDDPLARVADVGTCTLVVDNSDRQYSPLNAAGPHYGKLVPGKPVQVNATDGVSTWTLFTGVTKAFRPDALQYGTRLCTIECEDVLGRLQAMGVSIPVFKDRTADFLAGVVAAAADPTATRAGGGYDYAATTISDGDTFSVGRGPTVKETYTFRSVLTATPNEVKIEATKAATVSNLVAAIINSSGAGTRYSTGTRKSDLVTASWNGVTAITIMAVVPGAWGNSLFAERVTSGTPFAVGFAGGSGGLTLADTGILTLEVAADRWNAAETNAMTALQDIVDSEQGLLWGHAPGGLTFRNQQYLFTRAGVAPALVIDDQMSDLDGGLSVDTVWNRVTVTYTPRGTTSSGVIAKANNVIEVPGVWGSERYNPSDPVTAGMVVVRIPAVDPGTGRLVGIESVELPLVAGVNYTVNDRQDGSGFDYTASGRITTSVAVTGTELEVSFKNTAGGSLYVRGLTINGTAFIAYDEQQVLLDDATSQAAYGRRPVAVNLPFPSQNAFTFAQLLAGYLLSRYKDPAYEVNALTFQAVAEIGGVHLYSLGIGSVIQVTETQTGLSGAKFMIAGLSLTAEAGQRPVLTWRLRSLDNTTYWILEHATYGLLGTTTRLAL